MTHQGQLRLMAALVALTTPLHAFAQDRSDLFSPRTLALWALLIVVAFLVSRRRAHRAYERARKEALKQESTGTEQESTMKDEPDRR